MAKVVSASEAKSRFGFMLKQAKQEQVIIEVHGAPEAVLISYHDYQLFEGFKEQNRRREAWEAFKSLRDEVSAQTLELTEQEAYELAGISEEVAKEIIQEDKKASSKKR